MTTGLTVSLHLLLVFLGYPEQKMHSPLYSHNSKSHVSYLEVTKANVGCDVASVKVRRLFHCGYLESNYIDTKASLGNKRDYRTAGAITIRDTLCHFNALRSFKWDNQSEQFNI